MSKSEFPKNWLITGGCGFIGTNFVKRLLDEGIQHVRILDNLAVGNREDLARICDFKELPVCDHFNFENSDLFRVSDFDIRDLAFQTQSHVTNVQLIVADIRDSQVCRTAATDMDVIVHLAANTGVPQSIANPAKDMESNIIGTFNMMEAAREQRVNRFIFASSGAPIGECEPPIHEEMPCHPVSPYGASKLAGEAYCSAYFNSYGIDTVSLRFGNVYGPLSNKKGSVVAKFIKLAREGSTLEIYGDGTQTRDFIYIDDLIDAILCASITEKVGGETFQIATNSERTVNELVDLLVPALQSAGIKEVNVYHGEKRKGDVLRNFSDTSKAKRILDWEAGTPLEEGLRKTIQWFLSQKDV